VLDGRKLLAVAAAVSLSLIDATSSALAYSNVHVEGRRNPEHIGQLPAEVRHAIKRVCSQPSRAEHLFATYFQNSRLIKLHFEHFLCGDQGRFCNKTGCLHQIYISTEGHYRLLRSYYGPQGD
jgi:hypothetical protein